MRIFKRILRVAAPIVLILALAVAASAACAEHTPDDGVVVLEPNCNTIGIINYTCRECGETYEQKMGNLGHDFDGEGICTRCGTEDYNRPAQTTSNGSAETLTTTAPKTADGSALLLWSAVLAASVLGICTLRRRAFN